MVYTICCSEGIPWVVLREIAPLLGVYLEEGILPLQEQRALQEPWSGCSAVGLVTAFLCVSQDFHHHAHHATAFLGQNGARYAGGLFSRGGEWVCTLAGPLRFRVLNPRPQAEIK